MWLEAVFAKDDLTAILERLLPVKLDLGGGWLEARDPRDVQLLPDRGLRATCTATVHWPVLGIEVPIAMHALTLVLSPQILPRGGRDVLAFHIEIEHADLTAVPTVIDDRITERVNAALAARHFEPSWDFLSALSRKIDAPKALSGIDAFDLAVRWGRLRITEEALVFALSFRLDVIHDRHHRHDRPRTVARTPRGARTTHPRPQGLAIVAGLALLAASGLAVGANAIRR